MEAANIDGVTRESVSKLIEEFKLYEYSLASAEILLGKQSLLFPIESRSRLKSEDKSVCCGDTFSEGNFWCMLAM